MKFENRSDAGKQLAKSLEKFREHDVLVVALPRGGVPVGAEVARSLNAPLEIVVIKKIGAPFNPELAIGAVAANGETWLNVGLIKNLGISHREVEELKQSSLNEAIQKRNLLRPGSDALEVQGKTIILVDDGLATGATVTAAVHFLRTMQAKKIIVAVPVAASESAQKLRSEADEVISLIESEVFFAVGHWYRDFKQTTDEEVKQILSEFNQVNGSARYDSINRKAVVIESEEKALRLEGQMQWGKQIKAWVLFAHGSGSTHRSPRNREVADRLNRAGFATLLFDLLMPHEAYDRRKIFDIPLLAARLETATRWLQKHAAYEQHPIGYFGASTGAAAALTAAAHRSNIFAVVSRGGRPDLAIEYLHKVNAPTLLIVGEKDETVLALNRSAAKRMVRAEIVIIPGATHLFEEPGCLEKVAESAQRWFSEHLSQAGGSYDDVAFG